MNVRKQLLAVLVSLAAPAAALAAGPATAGAAEAAARSGSVATTPAAPAPTSPALGDRVHELVVNGASYNEAAARAAEEARPGEAGKAAQPSKAEVEQGQGYALSSYAAEAPTRG